MPVPVFTPLYRGIIRCIDPHVPTRLQPLWKHPCGPKTVFFWGPLQKWCLVLAGLSDTLGRPADKLSLSQATSLAVAGFIWSRYSLVITPRNWSLFAVNFGVGVSGLFQMGKVLRYQATKSGAQPVPEEPRI